MKKHLTNIVWGGVSLILALSAATACQQQLNVPDAALEPVDEIIFRAADPSLDAEVSTKATAVTELSSFYVSAVTGTPGSDTAVWYDQTFTGDNTNGYKYADGGKWWPAVDASYRFYASNIKYMWITSEGAKITVSNSTDAICAYSSNPTYKAKNTLSFDHIFARLGQVTVSAASGYTISGVSIKITPKTGGTYNLRTGAGNTDGTGWSGLATGSETVIGNAVGNTANDIYLVPGTYTLTASWTATKGDYTENIENMTCDVSLVAGKINKISTTLSGNAKEIVFNVSIAPWTDNNQVVEFPTEKVYSFGGLEIAPGPLMYEGGKYVIKDNWNYSSYNSVYGKNEGSTYFNFLELGKLFEKTDFSASTDYSIENILNPLDGWRLPTELEIQNIVYKISNGTPGRRSGSSVNGQSGKHYAKVQLTGVTHAGNTSPAGILLFPDNQIMTIKANGNNIETFDTPNAPWTANMTGSELQDALNMGCVFLPASGGWDDGDWEDSGTKCTLQLSNSGLGISAGPPADANLKFYITNSAITDTYLDKSYYYYPVRLVRQITRNKPTSNGVYIKYTDGTYSAYNDLKAGKTPVGVALKTDACSFTIHPSEGTNKTWSLNTSTLIPEVATATSSSEAKIDYAGKVNSAAVNATDLAGTAFTFARSAVYADGSIGWLPSCGELEQIRINVMNINTALSLIGGDSFDFATQDGKSMWTSTQASWGEGERAFQWFSWEGIMEIAIKTDAKRCRSVTDF